MQKQLKYYMKRLSIPIILLTASSLLVAQEEAQSEEQVFELSPFEVSGDSEIGYLATETLSGTRMRSKLGDVASSIDVLTEEFLTDVGASDMYDALDYVGNVSTFGGSGGIDENENWVWFSNPYMARGFRTSAVSADFFSLGKQPLDFYNRTRITVARGPNAILFGIGSPGGLVNASRNRPLFGEDMNDLQFKVDDYGSFRATLDASREIIDNQLAVRVSAVYDDRKEFLDPAGWEREGIYGAVTYRPFKKTSITVTGEIGNEARTFRYTTTNYDGINQWINAGSPVWRGDPKDDPDPENDLILGNGFINASPGSGLDRERKEVVVISGQPGIPVMNWQDMARTERFEIHYDENGIYYNDFEPGRSPHPDINKIRATGFTEETALWNYQERQLQGLSRQRELDWEDLTIFLTQELFIPELQLELVYHRQNDESIVINTFGHFFLQMDANELLPNGNPNPNFGVPYVESDRNQAIFENGTNETYRATLSYELDLTDRKVLGMGLGRYNFMGLYEDAESTSLYAGFWRAYVENLPGFPAGNLRSPLNRVRNRVYVDTDLTPEGATVEPYYVPDFTPIDRDGVKSAWVRHTSPRDILDKRESMVAAVQAFLWETKKGYERVILTGGVRRDREKSVRKNYSREKNVYEGDLWSGHPMHLDAAASEAVWDGTLNYGTWGEEALTESDTKTYSAIFKIREDLSVFYNFSDVFISASSLFTDIYDNFVDPTIGETKDLGIRWSPLDGKIVASLTVFETTAQDQRESTVRNLFKPEMEDIWEVVDPGFEVHRPFNERFVTLRNDTSEGLEFRVIGNLMPNWNMRLTVSNIETTITSRLPIVDRYIAEYTPLWEQNRNEPLLESAQAGDDYITVGDAIDRIESEIADLHALEGTVPNAQRDWKVVFNTTYRFRDGMLDGWALGGGFRYLSEDIIGYAYDVDSIEDGSFVVDPNKPFYGEEILRFDAMISYTTRIKGVWTRFQLNVDNLFNEVGTFPRSAVGDLQGNPYYGRQQVREPRNFQFTAMFKF